jgi:mRNA interferase RelE/StbE
MSAAATWSIQLTETAARMVREIKDLRVRDTILQTIRRLEHEPEKQGKPMVSELAGYRSLRAVGQRYRILYQVRAQQVTIYVVAVGIRKEGDKADIYALARKLLRLGLLEP